MFMLTETSPSSIEIVPREVGLMRETVINASEET
jgi:hypothetical protein